MGHHIFSRNRSTISTALSIYACIQDANLRKAMIDKRRLNQIEISCILCTQFQGINEKRKKKKRKKDHI
jgi:AMMECR1 domain-containing protein